MSGVCLFHKKAGCKTLFTSLPRRAFFRDKWSSTQTEGLEIFVRNMIKLSVDGLRSTCTLTEGASSYTFCELSVSEFENG